MKNQPGRDRNLAGSLSRRRCPYFPTHPVTDPCGRCRRFYSKRALSLVSGVQICPKCAEEIALAERLAQERRFTYRNFLTRLRSPRTAVMVTMLAALVLIVGGASAVFINLASAPVPYETIRRARVGFTQDFSLDGQGIDLVEAINGGGARVAGPATRQLLLEGDTSVVGLADRLRVGAGDIAQINGVALDHRFSSGQVVGVPRSEWHTSTRLVDGLLEPQLPGWRSDTPNLPLDLVFWSEKPFPLAKVVIWNHELEPTDSFVAEFEIYSASADPQFGASELTRLDSFFAPERIGANPFQLADDPDRREASWYLLRINANHGSPLYVSAAEIGLFGPEPLPAPTPGLRARDQN